MPDTYTLDEAYAHLLETATNAGRCPTCGRRHSDGEAKLFRELREQVVSVSDERDKLQQRVDKLRDDNDGLKVRNADLRAAVKDLRSDG